MTDSGLLRKIMEDNRWTVTAIADILGISRHSLYQKMENVTEFKASEITKLSEVLHLTTAQRDKVFFCEKK